MSADPAARRRLTPLDGGFGGVPAYRLDVPETIAQLGYGSHQFFRYYGKFPSVVGREIVLRHAAPGTAVLDCYAGSGTTLVEAQSAGLRSFGLDINPLATLACNVKTAYLDADALRAARDRVLRALEPSVEAVELSLLSRERLDKWFLTDTQRDLASIRRALLAEPRGPSRAFLLVAFLGVIRRVSTAYDGEVRPRVNPSKKPRSATLAFVKKVDEMIAALSEVDALRRPAVPARATTGDNRDPRAYARLLGDERPGLVVAHPPYLNSFNYLRVFSLELAWSEGFEEVWEGWTMQAIREREHRAWPATSEAAVSSYYAGLRATLTAAMAHAAPGATAAVVIGDATIRGELEPVHRRCWTIMEEIGLTPKETWFRTTHYGIGKYAYRHRADYHGDAAKRDAILFFTRR